MGFNVCHLLSSSPLLQTVHARLITLPDGPTLTEITQARHRLTWLALSIVYTVVPVLWQHPEALVEDHFSHIDNMNHFHQHKLEPY